MSLIFGISDTPVLLVNPGVACPTGPIFAAWDGKDRGALDPLSWIDGRNDLQAPAVELFPEIAAVLSVLDTQRGVRLARMSGSGATCFALFESMAYRDQACASIAEANPSWWTLKAALR